MTRNFLEIFALVPKDGAVLTSEVREELREILTILKRGPGSIVMEIRKDVADPNALVCIAGWESLADHDDLDIQGIVPRVLKKLLKHFITGKPSFMYIDVATIGAAFDVLGIHVFNVKNAEKAAFQKEIDARPGLVGSWHTVIPVPPLPKVMPTDPTELAIIEAQKAGAERNLRHFTPAIWVAFSTPETDTMVGEFRTTVDMLVEEVKTTKYQKFLSG
jgi:hypothetical protein